jgi:branched-chain amino acid transport system substrate-binding protein
MAPTMSATGERNRVLPTTRRTLLATAGGAAASAILPRHTAHAQGQTLRLGCITSLSGAQEILGRPILIGGQIAAAQINAQGGVLGKKIEIVERDDKAEATQALTVGRELIGNGVNLLFGIVTSPAALALTAIMQPSNAVLTICAASSDKLNHDAFGNHTFRVCDQAYMRQHAQAKLAAERFPEVTKWGAIIPDVEYGRSALAAFTDGLAKYYPQGKQASMAAPVLTRFGASDFKTQISTLMGMDIEGLFTAVYGGDGVTMLQQARPYGLLKKLKVISDTGNEFYIPKALGKNTPDTLWTGMHWYYGGYQNLPLGKALYDDYVAKTGDRYPLGFVNEGHSAVLGYAAAVRKAGSTDSAAVIAAMEGMTFDTAKGPVTFRKEDHQAICDVNFVRFETAQEAPGWKVAEFVRYPGADVIEPPTPGKPVAYRKGS